MSLIKSFAVGVPTYFVVYMVENMETGSLQFVKEFKTKGAAVTWIDKSGEKGVNYVINAYLRK